jgi:hypothetical protein
LSLVYTDFGQSPSLANYTGFLGFVPPPSACLPSSLVYTDLRQSSSASLFLSASLPSSLVYIDFKQSLSASLLLSLVNYTGFLGFVLPLTTSLPLYTYFEPSPNASLLLSLTNYASFLGFVLLPTATLCLSLANSKQSSSTSLDSNYANYQLYVKC